MKKKKAVEPMSEFRIRPFWDTDREVSGNSVIAERLARWRTKNAAGERMLQKRDGKFWKTVEWLTPAQVEEKRAEGIPIIDDPYISDVVE